LSLWTPDDAGEQQRQEKYRLYKAQISCIIYGSDEWQWIAYAFEDTQHNDEIVGELGSSKATFYAEDKDPILRGLDKEKPIWRPRQYFLKAFETQIRYFSEEWAVLVDKLEVDRAEYVLIRYPILNRSGVLINRLDSTTSIQDLRFSKSSKPSR
jgi:hypothetical protein